MKMDAYWIAEALKLAKKAAEEGEVPIGAILVNAEGEVLARNHNRTIQHIDPTAHAEILVLREAAERVQNYRLLNTTLYCTLEPCAMCAGALVQARVSRVVFGAYDRRSGALGSVLDVLDHPSLNHRAEVRGGICEEEVVKLLQNFFKERRSG